MAKYKCPECSEGSSVIETRDAGDKGLRRRRQCSNGHRFSTLEVPSVAPKNIVELVQWAIRNNVVEDFTQHVNNIMLGTSVAPEEEE